MCSLLLLSIISFVISMEKELNMRQIAKQMKIEFKLILFTPCLE